MKVYKETSIPARSVRTLAATLCDICNEDIDALERELNESGWFSSEVEVSLKEGYFYPEGGYGHEYSVDICRNCFLELIVPWLREHGVKVEKKDWDTY